MQKLFVKFQQLEKKFQEEEDIQGIYKVEGDKCYPFLVDYLQKEDSKENKGSAIIALAEHSVRHAKRLDVGRRRLPETERSQNG